jgi:hypothetical protein
VVICHRDRPTGPQKKEKEKEKGSAPIVMAITQLGIGCFIGFGKFFVVRFLAFPAGPRPGTRLPPVSMSVEGRDGALELH